MTLLNCIVPAPLLSLNRVVRGLSPLLFTFTSGLPRTRSPSFCVGYTGARAADCCHSGVEYRTVYAMHDWLTVQFCNSYYESLARRCPLRFRTVGGSVKHWRDGVVCPLTTALCDSVRLTSRGLAEYFVFCTERRKGSRPVTDGTLC